MRLGALVFALAAIVLCGLLADALEAAGAEVAAQKQTISWLEERVKEKAAQLDACWGDTL